jgi:hypothetical protein
MVWKKRRFSACEATPQQRGKNYHDSNVSAHSNALAVVHEVSLTLTANKVKEPLATVQTHAKLLLQESYLGDMNAL